MNETTQIARDQMRSVIQRIATGPEMSKDISYEEARQGMGSVLGGHVDPVQAGIFLIALRMKRETREENRGVLQALIDATSRVTAEVDEVVDIADPYDGYTRGLPVSAFLPSVLACCGVPAVLNGAESIGPKFGISHRDVLAACGIDVDLDPAAAADRLADPDVGWAYVDQRYSCPSLHGIRELRNLMVKRSCLATVEVLLKPVSGRRHTRLMTGFVHKPYPPIYTMLARHAGYESAMIVRGVEGGVVPSLQQPAKVFHYHAAGDDAEWRIAPDHAGILNAAGRAVPLPEDPAASADKLALAAAAARAGLAAINGEGGAAYDSLVYAGALVLVHTGRCADLPSAAAAVREVLDSKAAAERGFDRAGSGLSASG